VTILYLTLGFQCGEVVIHCRT